MKTYIEPNIKCIEISADNLMIDMSNGTPADPNVAVDSRLRRGRNVVDDIFYDDFDEE